MTRLTKSARTLPLVAVAAISLSACTLTATGSGTVTIDSDSAANAYDGITGTVAYLCEDGAVECHVDDPYLYSYQPEAGSTQWIVSPGFPVLNRAGQAVALPAGRYSLQASQYDIGATRYSNTVFIDVFSTSERDLTIWHQSHARHAPDAQCQEGWQASWAQWPNAGTGGFVCNRQIYAYYPDEPVR